MVRTLTRYLMLSAIAFGIVLSNIFLVEPMLGAPWDFVFLLFSALVFASYSDDITRWLR